MEQRNRHDLPCPLCGNNTACSLYSSPKPHLFCHKCKKYIKLTEEEYEYYNIMNNNILQLQNAGTPSKGNNLQMKRKNLFPLRGVIKDLTHRNIRRDVAEKYKTETLFDSEDKPYATMFPISVDGKMIAEKVKRFDKKQKWLYEGEGMPRNLPLFGQDLFPAGGKFLTITEGEEDALAAYQMLKDASPSFEPAVISIINGASHAEEECKINWEYINSFENIIIAFDGDEPGRKAAEKVCRLFDYKPKVVLFSEAKKVTTLVDGVEVTKWESKDSNDYLSTHREKDFVRMWWKAEKFNPKGVLSFSSLWSAMTEEDQDLVVPFPWKGLNDKLHGQRTGRLYIWKAPPKVGKTQVMREIVYHTRCNSPYNIGMAFLEDTKKTIGLGLCALHMNKPVQFPDIPFELKDLEKAYEFLSEDDRLTIFDPEDERTSENILNKIMYFAKAHDCKFIIVDHMSMLAYSSGEGDERRFLDKLTADFKALTTKLNICLHVIVHINDDGKTRGSRAPVQLCDALISLERNKLDPDPLKANTLSIIVEENRLTGDSGVACKLFFDRKTGRLQEIDEDFEANEEREVEFDE